MLMNGGAITAALTSPVVQGCATLGALVDPANNPESISGIDGITFTDPATARHIAREIAKRTLNIVRFVDTETGRHGKQTSAFAVIPQGASTGVPIVSVGHIAEDKEGWGEVIEGTETYELSGPGFETCPIRCLDHTRTMVMEGYYPGRPYPYETDAGLWLCETDQPNLHEGASVVPDKNWTSRHLARLIGESAELICVNTGGRMDLFGGVHLHVIPLSESADLHDINLRTPHILPPGVSGSPVFAKVVDKKSGDVGMACDSFGRPIIVGIMASFDGNKIKKGPHVPGSPTPERSFSVDGENEGAGDPMGNFRKAQGLVTAGGVGSVKIIWSWHLREMLRRNNITPIEPEGEVTILNKF